MKLLIVTQKVDEQDPILGFFIEWINEFAQHVDTIEIICLEQGNAHLSENVRVYSLGKEQGAQSRVVYTKRFLELAWKLRNKYDAVFVHMNPEYVVLAGWMWRLLGKRVSLWYLHKSVTWKLQVASLWADALLTSTPESLRIQSKKIHIIGHGINLAELTPLSAPQGETIQLLTIGRLSPVKRVHLLIEAISELRTRNIPVHFTIVGSAAGTEGTAYEKKLQTQVDTLNLQDTITFVGSIQHKSLMEYFGATHVFLHASDTGSLDKALLEPLAVGIPVVSTSVPSDANEVLGLIQAEPFAIDIANKVQHVIKERMWDSADVRRSSRIYIENTHSLQALIPKILRILFVVS